MTLLSQVLSEDGSGPMVHHVWRKKLFYVSSERQNPGSSPVDAGARLEPDARNLAAVLLKLNGERGDTFEKLVNHLREIFPSVGNISIRIVVAIPVLAEIRIWPTRARDQVDLSFPLSESGTGIAQVLTILAAAATTAASVILIDEISSFLHPSATKILLRIINSYYSEHQYILTTHSTEVVNFSSPKSLHLVKRYGYQTSVLPLDLSEIQSFRTVADDLGVSMADVFAADNVIWVEGPTEEVCFPLLYESSKGDLPQGTRFISVVVTGDFFSKRRSRKLVLSIYERLTEASAVLAMSTKFHFDSEELSATDKQDIERQSRGRVSFLPRRNFECYLVNSDAILAFLVDRDNPEEICYTSRQVQENLILFAATDFQIDDWKGDLRDVDWLRKVDGANLIATTCAKTTNYRVTFNKKEDALFILKYIVREAPAEISELSDYVDRLVQTSICRAEQA